MAQIKDLKRMCESYNSKCADCPLCGRCCAFEISDEIVDKWLKEHPVKTYAMNFFEKFPNAPKDDDGTPKLCIIGLYEDEFECPEGGCKKCWNQEMKENE